MPRNVRLFAWLWCISFLSAVVEIFLMPPPDPTLVKRGITLPVEQVAVAVVMVVMLAIFLPFFWLTVWRRKNWARWLLFILFVAPMPILFLDPLLFRPDHRPMIVAGLVSFLAEALAFFFIFTGDAKQWFQAKNSK